VINVADNTTNNATWGGGATGTCPECKRVFDLTKTEEAAEWFYGHDCEV